MELPKKPTHRFQLKSDWILIIVFALSKLLIHLLTYQNFELHRDAYLYYAQSEHLAWGYIAVPPFIAIVGKLATAIFGNTTFALRFFPALIGAINLLIIGMAVRELKGKWMAITLASLAYLLSPAYLHTNMLFQPVSFNHFFWLLSGYAFILLINRENPKFWILIAIIFGIGFLNKYSIVFLYAAFGIAIPFTSYRKLLVSKYFLVAIILGLLIILPNLWWQYQHNWPVLFHMSELRERQLVHVRISDFMNGQFTMNIQAVLIWLPAVLLTLFYKKENKFRVFGLTYVLVIALLIAGSGKTYYSLGIYLILFVLGACQIEKYLGKFRYYVAGFIILFMAVIFSDTLTSNRLPFTTFKKAQKENAYRWEDGKYHNLPQDMADMTGWKEIGEKTSEIYLGLGEEYRDDCEIFCDHYGQAGAVMFYGKKIDIPQPSSTNGSFAFWSAENMSKRYFIYVQFDPENGTETDSLLSAFFKKFEVASTIRNENFRENGTKIYLCENPTKEGKEFYQQMMGEVKRRYKREE